MTSLALRSLIARKLRAILTALAVVVGISMICGQPRPHRHHSACLHRTSTTLPYAGSDVVVSGDEPTELSASGTADRARLGRDPHR